PIPPMSPAQALQLLHLHWNAAWFWDMRPDRRPKRGESSELRRRRAGARWRAEKASDREGYEVARAGEEGGEAPPGLEPPAPLLPDLSQVTGWSKACP